MARLARRLALVLTVIVAFVAMQTGSACAFEATETACAEDCAGEPGDDCEDEHAPACSDEHEMPCPPVCADCPGCAGPLSAVLSAMDRSPEPHTLQVVLDDVSIERVATTHGERIDRPPRV